MNEEEFDNNIEEEIDTVNFPSNQVSINTPWKRDMIRIMIGIFLCTITFNFYYLQYLLPMVGVLFILTGLRMMKNNNLWFRICYLIAGFNVLHFFISLIIYASTLSQNQALISNMIIIKVCIYIGLIMSLYLGLRLDLKKLGMAEKAATVLLFFGWYIVVVLIGLYGLYIIWLLILVTLGMVMLIDSSMNELLRSMEKGGYQSVAVNLKVSNRWFCCILIVGMFLGVTISCFLSYYDFSKGTIVSAESSQTNGSLRKNLIELGAPKEVVNDLQEADVEHLRTAVSCKSTKEKIIIQDKEVTITNLLFNTPDDNVYAMAYFQWNTPSLISFGDVIHIENYYHLTPIGGKIYYQKNQKEYSKNIKILKNGSNEGMEQNSDFFGTTTDVSKYIYAEFDYPWNTKNQRGYILYFFNSSEGLCTSVLVNYYRQENLYQIPYQDPASNYAIMSNFMANGSAAQSYEMSYDPTEK